MPWTVADVEEHKKGLSAKQKRKWVAVANSVLKRCMDEGGSEETCAASAIRQANGVAGNEAEMSLHAVQIDKYIVRTEQHQGHQHLVVPVIMMVEGVHAGSHGPLLHPAEELGRFVETWNGIPVVIQHPERDGTNVSANSPDIIDTQTVGRIYNAHMDGQRLCAEAWIDQERIASVSPETLNLIQSQRRLDVSVGVFSEDDLTPGTWNGEEYTGIARGHRPDHLALLPGGQGACSWDDGCGVRANEDKGGKVAKEDEVSTTVEIKADDLDVTAKGLSAQGYFMVQADAGFRQIMENIQGKLDRMDDDVKIHFLQDVYKDYFIYEVRGRMGAPVGGAGLYKRNYSVGTDGAVEFSDEPKAVRREINYVENSAKGGSTPMADNVKKCCPEKVQLLIASAHAPYQEADREWLSSLEEAQIDKLVSMEKMLAMEPEERNPITNEQAVQVLQAQLRTPDQFIQLLPEEMRDQMTSALRLHQKERARLVEAVKAASRYTDDQLKTKTMAELSILADMARPRDFSGLAGGQPLSSNDVDNLLPPPGIVFESEGGR